MKKLKTGDKVRVIAGSERGKEGKISKILDGKVIVEGLNMVKKHLKPKSNGGTGEIIETEAPIHVSNIKLLEKTVKKETKKVVKKEVKTEVKKETKKVTKKEPKAKKANK